MHTQSLPQEPDQATEQLRWLPDSRVWRVVLGVLAAGVIGLVFAAYLSPNMVLDFANVVFCG